MRRYIQFKVKNKTNVRLRVTTCKHEKLYKLRVPTDNQKAYRTSK